MRMQVRTSPVGSPLRSFTSYGTSRRAGTCRRGLLAERVDELVGHIRGLRASTMARAFACSARPLPCPSSEDLVGAARLERNASGRASRPSAALLLGLLLLGCDLVVVFTRPSMSMPLPTPTRFTSSGSLMLRWMIPPVLVDRRGLDELCQARAVVAAADGVEAGGDRGLDVLARERGETPLLLQARHQERHELSWSSCERLE
jgi:hypothetical protein